MSKVLILLCISHFMLLSILCYLLLNKNNFIQYFVDEIFIALRENTINVVEEVKINERKDLKHNLPFL